MDKSTSLITRSFEALASLKAAMRFPGQGGSNGMGTIGPIWQVLNDVWSGLTGRMNYAEEVGDLGGVSLVMSAVNWLGRVLPEARLNVVKIDSNGMETPIPNHPASKLWRRPNPFYSGTTLCKAYAYSWIVSGNPYFRKIRNKGGEIVELWYVPPQMMTPVWPRSGNEFISGYEYVIDGQTELVPPEDVIHFRDGIDPHNIRLGLSPVASVLREIYTDQQIAQYSALLMKNGAVPPVIISLKEGINAMGVDTKRVRETYLQQTQGDERGKAWVSGLSIDVNKVGFNPTELNLAQLRRLPEERLSAVIGIPAIVLGYGAGLDKATYSNARQAAEFATESYLVPLYSYIEEELTTQLLPDFGGDTDKVQCRFDLSGVRALSEDQDALYTRLTAAFRGGWMMRSEAREMAGYEWEEHDEVYAAVPLEDPLEEEEDENEDEQDAPVDEEAPAPDAETETDEEVVAPSDSVPAKALEFKAKKDAQIIEDGHAWLLHIGADEAAEMILAKPTKK